MGRVREPVPFAKGSNRYIRSVGRYMVMLCGITQIKYVAVLLGVGWDLVKDAFKADLKRRHKRRPLRKIRCIAVDEFATHKGHKYRTVVLDLESGEILHAQEAKVKAIAVDMSEAYASAVREVFGGAVDLVTFPSM